MKDEYDTNETQEEASQFCFVFNIMEQNAMYTNYFDTIKNI